MMGYTELDWGLRTFHRAISWIISEIINFEYFIRYTFMRSLVVIFMGLSEHLIVLLELLI